MAAAQISTRTTALDSAEYASPRIDAPRDSRRLDEYARDKKPVLCAPHSASYLRIGKHSYVFASIAPLSTIASLKTASVPCVAGLAQSSACHTTASGSALCYSRSVRSFALACVLGLRLPIIRGEESPRAEGFVGPPANLRLEPGRSSLEPRLGYQRSTKIGCCRLAPRARGRVPRALSCSVHPFFAKTGGHFFLSRLFFQYKQLQTVYMGSSTGV